MSRHLFIVLWARLGSASVSHIKRNIHTAHAQCVNVCTVPSLWPTGPQFTYHTWIHNLPTHLSFYVFWYITYLFYCPLLRFTASEDEKVSESSVRQAMNVSGLLGSRDASGSSWDQGNLASCVELCRVNPWTSRTPWEVVMHSYTTPVVNEIGGDGSLRFYRPYRHLIIRYLWRQQC